MISKELLSEVLASPTKVDYYGLSLFGYGNKNLLFKWKSSIDCTEVEDSINIYELAYKCKEWAWSLNFDLQVKRYENDAVCCAISERNITYHKAQWGIKETEAIFKACQWVLDHKGK